MQETLEQALADEREELQLLRKRGYLRDVELIERVLDRVQKAAEDWLTWLPEKDALLRCGRPKRWLTAQRAQWLEDGNAKLVDGKWYYRQCVVPRRGNPSAAREAGRRAGKDSTEQAA